MSEGQTRKMKISIDRTPEIQRLQDELEQEKTEKQELKDVLSSLAEREYAEKRQSLKERVDSSLHSIIDDFKNPDEMEKFVTLYEKLTESQPTRKASTGVVSLRDPQSLKSLRYRQFENPAQAIRTLFEEKARWCWFHTNS